MHANTANELGRSISFSRKPTRKALAGRKILSNSLALSEHL